MKTAAQTVLALLLLIPSIACAQTRGSITTISADGTVSVTAPRSAVTRAAAYSGYPVRGGNWTYPGSGRADLIRHLQSGEHRGKFSREYLESLSYSQLLSAHSDHHEGRVKWSYVRKPVRQSYRGPRYQSFCPTGNCPNF